MPLDPSIALGVKPIEIADPLAQYAKMSAIQNAQNQNNLAQYQLSAAQRADADAEAVRNALRGVKYGTPEYETAVTNAMLGTGNVKGLQEYQRGKSEAAKSAVELKIKQDEANRAMYGDLAMNPSDENIKAYLQDGVIKGDITLEKAAERWNHVAGMSLAQRADFFNKGAMTAHQRVGHDISREQLNVSKGQLGVAQGQLKLAQENAAKPTWNEAGQGWVTPPTAKNPSGNFTPVPQVQETKDQRSAVKALKTAGYDVETGTDEISKLIAQSTGGMSQQAGSAALGAFNITTSGREAIGRLKTRANQISLDMLNGKLGAGISNDDRNFIVSTLGNVADPAIPSGERLAAWDEAKKRMVSSGMLPAPKGAAAAPAAPAAPAANVPAVPKGVDQSIWNAMTPEERALWK